jgi:hypothetical protein
LDGRAAEGEQAEGFETKPATLNDEMAAGRRAMLAGPRLPLMAMLAALEGSGCLTEGLEGLLSAAETATATDEAATFRLKVQGGF